MSRPNKHEYISQLCELVASRSTCIRLNVGCIFVNDSFEILATGYNGAPSKSPECLTAGCLLDANGGCIRTVHAEQNAILQGMKHGVNLEGSVVYVTHSPCYTCAKLLVSIGIKEIRFKEMYRDSKPLQLLFDNYITVKQWKDVAS